jgi:2-amino-4-hydroxy-6-hydroxymethyldihydropteridine diphosphokinase
MTWHRAWIALGSNLGDRARHIQEAIDALTRDRDIELVAMSGLIETDPVGPTPQPRYLNAAAEVRTRLAPRELLARLLLVEASRGRERSAGARNAPRTIDLDLLLYADRIIDEPGLSVPHPRMHKRSFVLDPLDEIASDLVHPALGCTIGELRNRLRKDSGSKLKEGAAGDPMYD